MKLNMFHKLTTNSVIRQYIAGITCAISITSIGSICEWTAPAIPKIKNHEASVQLTNSEITWMVSILYIGNLISPIPCGYLMDRIGRKATLLYSTTFSLASWIIIYFARNPYHLYIARFLSGFSTGITYIILPVYLGEISEPKIRGSIGNLMPVMVNIGALIEYCIGPYVSYYSLIIISCLAPVAFIATFAWMPESPYYYMMKNDNKSAIDSLTWLRYDKKEDDIITELNAIDLSIKNQMQSKGTYKDLLVTESNRKSLIMALGLAVFQRMTGIGPFMAYSSVTVPENSFSWMSLNQCMTLLSIVMVIANIVSSPFVDKFKRKTLLIISNAGCAFSTLIVSIWFYSKEHTSYTFLTDLRWLPYMCFLLFISSYGSGMGTIGSSYRGEIFSANVKGKASALILISMSVVSFVIGKTYLTIADNYGMYLNYLIYSVSGFVSLLFFKFYLIETKGKTLQKIQDELNGVIS